MSLSSLAEPFDDAMRIPLLRLFSTICTSPPAEVAAVLPRQVRESFTQTDEKFSVNTTSYARMRRGRQRASAFAREATFFLT